MIRWTAAFTLIICTVGGTTGFATAAPPPIALYYKEPLQQPLVYTARASETVQGYDGRGRREQTTVEKEQTFTNTYHLVSSDLLRVLVEFRGATSVVNGKVMPLRTRLKNVERQMDVKGYRRKVNKQAADFDKLDVILPSYKVSVGDSWDYTAPPTTDLPLYLTTRFTLTTLARLDDRDVAVIDAVTQAAQTERGRHLNVRVRARGHILFAYREGILLSSEFTYQLVTDSTDHPGRGIVQKDVKTNLRLVSTGQ